MKTFNIKQSLNTVTTSKKSVAILATSLLGAALLATASTANADEVTYVVKSGDTLSQISEKYYNDQAHIQSIAKANHVDNASMIYVGQTLTFNTESSADTTAEATTTTQAPVTAAPEATTTTQATQVPATTGSINTRNGFNAGSAKEAIAMTESGGSYTAQNGQYYGRYQLSSSYLNGDYSAANQERVADNYVASRYGSWEAAWQFHQAHGWY